MLAINFGAAPPSQNAVELLMLVEEKQLVADPRLAFSLDARDFNPLD